MIQQGDLLLAFDLETGGVDEKCTSLLTGYFCVTDDKLNIIDELHLKLKPNNGEAYRITAGALNVNHIDLVAHDKVAITYSEGGQKLREFLWKHSKNGAIKLIPTGQNIGFDELFVWEQLLGKREYQKYVSYRHLDTGVIGQFLKMQGKIPKTVSGSLTSYMEHFKLQWRGGAAHDEKGDTWATLDILAEMIKL